MKHKAYTLPKLATKAKPGLFNPDGMLFYDVWLDTQREWDRTCRAYEANPGSFFNAWTYLNDHPIYWRLMDGRRPIPGVVDQAAVLFEDIDGADVNQALKDDLRDGVARLEACAGGRSLYKGPRRHARNLETGCGFAMGSIDITVARVNPADGRISDDPALNTQVEFWFETGEWPWDRDGVQYHNWRLDGRAPTYEEAVIKLAKRVRKWYGNDRAKCEPEYSARKAARRAGDRRGTEAAA